MSLLEYDGGAPRPWRRQETSQGSRICWYFTGLAIYFPYASLKVYCKVKAANCALCLMPLPLSSHLHTR